MESYNKSAKLGSLKKVREIKNLIIANAGSPVESIGDVNFVNGTYQPIKTVGGRMSFEKKISLGGFDYISSITWNKNFKCWIISSLGGPQYNHPLGSGNINFNGSVIEPGDSVYSPSYQYISFSDVLTPDLAENWIRSFMYGKISSPEISVSYKYSDFENIENPKQHGVFDLKNLNGETEWFESSEYRCPPFITSVEQINDNQIAINFVRLGSSCADPTVMMIEGSEDRINWGSSAGNWVSPRIFTKPSVKKYYRGYFIQNNDVGARSNIVEFDPATSTAPVNENLLKSCAPYITSISRNGNNTIGVYFTTLSSDCHTPVYTTLEFSVDQVNWSGGGMGGFTSPRTNTLPTVNTFYRMKLNYSPFPESVYSNVVMYDINSPILPGVELCCPPILNSIVNHSSDPNLVLISYSLGTGTCLPVSTMVIQTSEDGGLTWSSGGNISTSGPTTMIKPAVGSKFRLTAGCGLSGNSVFSNILTYNP